MINPQSMKNSYLVKDKINKIAALLYKELGYQSPDEFDFQESTHPTEKLMFELACIAWEEITGDYPDLYADFKEN